MSSACFVLKDQIEDTGLKCSIKKLYEIDKVPSTSGLDGDSASQNDLRFLDMPIFKI